MPAAPRAAQNAVFEVPEATQIAVGPWAGIRGNGPLFKDFPALNRTPAGPGLLDNTLGLADTFGVVVEDDSGTSLRPSGDFVAGTSSQKLLGRIAARVSRAFGPTRVGS